MERGKTSCGTGRTAPYTFSNMDFNRCLFFTNEQFNIKKVHIPTYSLHIQQTIMVNSLVDIENTVNTIIDNIYIKLNENRKGNVAYKIPTPIFVILGRELEVHKSVFGNSDNIPLMTNVKFGETQLRPIGGQLAIIDFIQAFFRSGFHKTTDINKYNSSILTSYTFKGRVRIIVYVPYLTNKYKYISNLKDILKSLTFFTYLFESSTFLTKNRSSTFNDKEFRKELEKLFRNELKRDRVTTEGMINKIINPLIELNRRKYTLYDDLNNLCFEGGCVANEGDDFERLLPQFTNDAGKNSENAIKYSPFIPTKCLAQTNNHYCHIMKPNDAPHNVDIIDFIKTYAMEDIKIAVLKYIAINMKMTNNIQLCKKDVRYIDKYKSPIDMIIAIANIYIRDGFGTNLNDKEKQYKLPKEETKESFANNDDEPEECRREDPEKPEIKIKMNHYSKEYSENIITELMHLHKLYPGVPEFVMSLYSYKENVKSDKLVYMPFGRPIPTNDYVIHIGEEFMIGNKLFSFNNRYALTINKNGFVYVYDVNNRNILYFLFKGNAKDNFISMTFETTGLIITYKDMNDNLKPISKDIMPRVPLIKSNCDDCSEPYTIILNDNGDIVVYGNAFYDATFDGFKELIRKERDINNGIAKQMGTNKDLLNVDNLNSYIESNNNTKLNQYSKLNNKNLDLQDTTLYIYRANQ